MWLYIYLSRAARASRDHDHSSSTGINRHPDFFFLKKKEYYALYNSGKCSPEVPVTLECRIGDLWTDAFQDSKVQPVYPSTGVYMSREMYASRTTGTCCVRTKIHIFMDGLFIVKLSSWFSSLSTWCSNTQTNSDIRAKAPSRLFQTTMRKTVGPFRAHGTPRPQKLCSN